ncbi:Endothelial differentiation- factor 1, partial [Cladochytrium tenue]
WVYAEDDIGDLDEVRQAALAHLDTVFEGGGIRPNNVVGHSGAAAGAAEAPATVETAASAAEAAAASAAQFEDASEDGDPPHEKKMSDWDSVTVIRKRADKPAVLKSESAVNAAKRSGATVSTEKKTAAANTKAPVIDSRKAAKIDNETEDFHVQRVSMSVGRAIQQGRQGKNFTQKDLATKINEKPTVVAEYESGKAVPNQQVLGKMERILGVKLRGQDIGSPLGGK